MKKLLDRLEYVQIRLAAVFLTIFIVCIILQVATRYVPGFSLLWTEEIANYSFIWAVLMGASVMVRHQEHFSLNLIKDKLKGRAALVNDLFISGLIAVFGLLLFGYGLELTLKFWNWTVNSLPVIKQRYVWMVMPVTGLTMTLYAIGNMTERIQKSDIGGVRQ